MVQSIGFCERKSFDVCGVSCQKISYKNLLYFGRNRKIKPQNNGNKWQNSIVFCLSKPIIGAKMSEVEQQSLSKQLPK